MRHALFFGAGMTISSLFVGPESLHPIEQAAHRPPIECIEVVKDELGDSLLPAIHNNVNLADESEEEHRGRSATSQELIPLNNPVHRDQYIDERVRNWSTFILPQSGIKINLGSELTWNFDSELFEEVWSQSYEEENKEDAFATVVNRCIANLIFEDRALEGQEWTYLLLGDGTDKRLYGDYIADYTVGRKGAVGTRTFNGLIIVLAHDSDTGKIPLDTARTLLHETDHAAVFALGAVPFDGAHKEYRARITEETAAEIMTQEGVFLVLN